MRKNFLLGLAISLLFLSNGCGKNDALVKSSIKANEAHLAKDILYKYGDRTYREISKRGTKAFEKGMVGIWSMWLKSGKWYLPLTSLKGWEPKIIAHDITVLDKNTAKARIIIKPVLSLSSPFYSDIKYVKSFNKAHSEPYEFLAKYARYGNKWMVESWKMIGKDYDDRPPVPED